jgi:hypothetical protein
VQDELPLDSVQRLQELFGAVSGFLIRHYGYTLFV